MSVFSSQSLRAISSGAVPMVTDSSGESINDDGVQPASIDCPLGGIVYRVMATALPRCNETIEDLLERLSQFDFTLNETRVLERGATYIIPLNIKLHLAKGHRAVFSPKSTIGRNDVFVRVLSDCGPHYDVTRDGYVGGLYLEVTPLSFSVYITPGLAMVQMRIISSERSVLDNQALNVLHSAHGMIRDGAGQPLSPSEVVIKNNSVYLHLDLDREIVGWEAIQNPGNMVDLSQKKVNPVDDFWRKILRPKNGQIILTPGHFYLLATKERVKIPPDHCSVIVTYDVETGEFRTHYAGFFDNGFGGEEGTHAVLEVRPRDVAASLHDGHPMCRMEFEKTDEVPDTLYGQGVVGTYRSHHPCLGKNYIDFDTVWI